MFQLVWRKVFKNEIVGSDLMYNSYFIKIPDNACNYVYFGVKNLGLFLPPGCSALEAKLSKLILVKNLANLSIF